MRRNGRPVIVGIMPIIVASSAALAVGYGLGEQAPLDRNHQRTFEALEVRDCIEHVTWGRWQITPLGETIAKRLTERNLE